ncbi:MAG: PKD domain-containing protein [Luteibaculaceae bacterium]
MLKARFFIFFTISFFAFNQSFYAQLPNSTVLWLNADSVPTSPVSLWQDLSVSQFQLTQTDPNRYPTKIENVINGKSVINFDGTNDFLIGGNILNLGLDNWSMYTVSIFNNSPFRYSFSKFSENNSNIGGYGYGVGSNPSRTRGLFVDNLIRVIEGNVLFFANTWHTSEIRINRNTSNFQLIYNNIPSNSISLNISPELDLNSSTPFLIGGFFNSTSTAVTGFFNGRLAEIIFLKNPTLSQRDSVYRYLGLKYASDLSHTIPDTLNILASCPIAVTLDAKWQRVFLNGMLQTSNTFTPSNPGWNYYSATGPFGFPLRDSIFINLVNPAPPSDFTLCPQQPIFWNIQPLDSSYQITWSTGAVGNAIEITTAGTYTLNITRGSCERNFSFEVVDLDNLISLEPSFAVCSGSQITANIPNPLPPFLTFEWSNGQTTPTINLSNSESLSATLSNSRGCTATVNTAITIVGIAPNTGFSFSGTCLGATFVANDTTSFFGAESIAQRFWILNGDTLVENSTTLSFPLNSSNPFTLILSLVNSGGCSSFFMQNITVNPLPVVNFSLAPTCLGKTLNPNNTSSNPQNLSFLWEVFDMAGNLLATSNQQSPSFNLDSNISEITVQLTATNMLTQCLNSLTQNFTFTPVLFCAVGNFAELWLNADSIPVVGNIQTWTDLSPNQYPISQAATSARPIAVSQVINGRNAVQFNGTSHFLSGGNILNLGLDNWSMFSVVRFNNNNFRYAFSKLRESTEGTGGYAYGVGINANRTRALFIDNQIRTIEGNTAFPANTFHTAEIRINRSLPSIQMMYNNLLSAEQSLILAPSLNLQNDVNFILGGIHAANGTTIIPQTFLNGQIAEIIFLKNPTPAQRDSVYTYLGLKYASDLSYTIPDTLNILASCPVPVSLDEKWQRVFLNGTLQTSNTFTPSNPGWNYYAATGPFGFPLRDSVFVNITPLQTPNLRSFCAEEPVMWNPGLSELYSYTWSNGSSQAQLQITEAGAYNVTVSTGACSVTSPTLNFYDLASSSLGQSSQDLCSGNTLSLQPDFCPSLTYLWSTGSTQPEITLTESGTYWVQVTNANGCVAQDTVQVNIIGIAPNVDFSVNGNCAQNLVEFQSLSSAQGSTPIVEEAWTIQGAQTVVSGGGSAVNFTFPQAGNYPVWLRATTQEGCADSLQITVQIDPLPVPAITHNLLCHNREVSLNSGQSSISSGFIAQRTWLVEGNTFSGQQINYTFAQPGNIPAKLTLISDAGCLDTLIQVLPVQGTPGVSILAPEVCVGSPSVFSAVVDTELSGTVNQFLWNFGNGNQASFSTAIQQFNNPGTFNVSLQITANNGCNNSTFLPYTVHPFPVASFTAGSFCAGSAGNLQSTATLSAGTINQWQWRIDNALFSAEPNASISIPEPGTYSIRHRVISAAGCSNETQMPITVNPVPQPSFTFSPNIGLPPLTVQFTNNTPGTGNQFVWNFGDGNTSTATNPSHVYLAQGNFTINLSATTPAGCLGSTERSLNVTRPDIDLVLQNLSFEVQGSFLYPVLQVINLSNTNITQFTIEAGLLNGSKIVETWFGNLPIGALLNLTANTGLFYQPERQQQLCVTIGNANGLNFDLSPENNSLCIALNSAEFRVLNPYPNPTNGKLTVSWISPDNRSLSMSLTDILGNTILPLGTLPNTEGLNTLTLNLETLPKGVYLLQVNYRDKREVVKVVRQ